MINLLKCVLHKSFSKEKLTWEGVCYNIVKKPKLFFSSTKKKFKTITPGKFSISSQKTKKKKVWSDIFKKCSILPHIQLPGAQ